MQLRAFLVAGTLLVCTALGLGAQAPVRIGYIDSAVLLEEAPGAQEATQILNREFQGYQAEIDRMSEALQQAIEQFERQQLTLSPAARDQRTADIRQREAEYRQRVSQLEEQAGRRQQELLQPVMDRVTNVIEQLRAEGSYALILDTASIISADPALDLTEEVLRRLRANTTGPGGR